MPRLAMQRGSPVKELEQFRATLRFQNSAMEAFFVRVQKPITVRNTRVGLVIAILVYLGMIFYTMGAQPANSAGHQTKELCILVDVALATINAVMLLVLSVPRCVKALSPVAVEAIVVALLSVNIVLFWGADAWYAAKLLGHDPISIWHARATYNFSDTRPLLGVATIIAGSHLLLPIRCIMYTPLEVLGLIPYAVCSFVLGGPDGILAWSSLLQLAALIMIAAVGRRTMEQLQRESLHNLIGERELRVRTEFELEQREGEVEWPRRQLGQDDHSSVHESRPETTDSDIILKGARLEDAAALGLREQWYIHSTEFELGTKVLGEGGYGRVVAGRFHGSPVAVKMTKMLEGPGYSSALMALLNEVRILRRLRHPNIVLFHGASVAKETNEVSLVLELVQGVTLFQAVLQGDLQYQPLSSRDKLRALVDTCRALRYLHSRMPAVLHADLKPQNTYAEMLPGTSGLIRAKLLDFGLSSALTKHAKHQGGTLMWMSPEAALNRSALGLKSDVFSWARLAFFVVTGKSPCEDLSVRQIRRLFQGGRVPQLAWPEDASVLARAVANVAEACSAFDSDLRPTMVEVQRELEELDGGSETRQGALGAGPPAPVEEAEEEQLRLSFCAATPDDTFLALIMDLLGRINMPKRMGACCALHTGVRALRQKLNDFDQFTCQEASSCFRPVLAQCPHCRNLLHERDAAKVGVVSGAEAQAGIRALRCPICKNCVELPEVQSL